MSSPENGENPKKPTRRPKKTLKRSAELYPSLTTLPDEDPRLRRPIVLFESKKC